jgi:hypothetical protein
MSSTPIRSVETPSSGAVSHDLAPAGSGDEFVTALGIGERSRGSESQQQHAGVPSQSAPHDFPLPPDLMQSGIASRLDHESLRNLSLASRQMRPIAAGGLVTGLSEAGRLDPASSYHGLSMKHAADYSDVLDHRGFIDQALTAQNKQVRSKAIGDIAFAYGSRLPPAHSDDLLTGTLAIEDPSARASALGSFSSHVHEMPPQFQLKWATAVRALPESPQRMRAMNALKIRNLTQEAKAALKRPVSTPSAAELFRLSQS